MFPWARHLDLVRLHTGTGCPLLRVSPLVEVSRGGAVTSPWVSRDSLRSTSGSPDPRRRTFQEKTPDRTKPPGTDLGGLLKGPQNLRYGWPLGGDLGGPRISKGILDPLEGVGGREGGWKTISLKIETEFHNSCTLLRRHFRRYVSSTSYLTPPETSSSTKRCLYVAGGSWVLKGRERSDFRCLSPNTFRYGGPCTTRLSGSKTLTSTAASSNHNYQDEALLSGSDLQ